MFDGIAAGRRSLAAGIASIGQAAGDFALKKQEAVNYATAVDAELKMKTAFADYKETLAKNPDEKTFLPNWEKRTVEVEKELGMEDMPMAVRDRLAPQMKAWRADTAQQVRSVATVREIDRGRATLEKAASFAMQEGDAVGAAKLMRDGQSVGYFTAEQAQDKIASFSNQAEYSRYERILTDTSQLTPAQQAEKLTEIESELTAKDGTTYKAGNLVDDEGKRIGGLNEPSRVNLIKAAREQKHSVETSMVRSFGPIAEAYERGGVEMGDAAMKNALEAGTVTVGFAQSMEGAMRGAYAKGAERRGKEASAEQEKALKEQRRQYSNFESMRGKLNELTPKRIMEEEKLGNLTTAQAGQLRAGLSGSAAVEMGLPSLKDARGNVVREKNDPRVLVDKYLKRAMVAGKDATMEERETMLNAIGQAPVSVATKAKLMRELIEGFDVDFRAEDQYQADKADTQMAAPGVYGMPSSWITKGGRKIDQWEKKVRGRIYGTLLQSGELGEDWTVGALLQAERDIAGFYSSEEYAKMPADKRNQFNDDLVKRIASQGSMRILDGIIR